MDTIADKIKYSKEAKGDIRNAIESKRVVVGEDVPFREYPNKIREIVMEIPTYEETAAINSNTTTEVVAREGEALSKVTATVNVVSKSSACKALFTSFQDKSGSNSASKTFTLPANKKCFVVVAGTTENSQTFSVSPNNGVQTLYNDVRNYFGQVYVRFTVQVFTINPSASSRTISVSASGSAVRHLFGYAIY